MTAKTSNIDFGTTSLPATGAGFFQTSVPTKNLYAALIKVQSQLKPVVKRHENPFFKSKYADLNDVWESVRELLKESGLCIIQLLDADDEGNQFLITELAHSSGESVRSKCKIVTTKNDAQSFGSAITYFRRFAISAILGITTEEDDDGNAASEGKGARGSHLGPTAASSTSRSSFGKNDGGNVPNGATAKETQSTKISKEAEKATEKQLKRLFAIAHAHDWTDDQLKAYCQFAFGIKSRTELSWMACNEIIEYIEGGGVQI